MANFVNKGYGTFTLVDLTSLIKLVFVIKVTFIKQHRTFELVLLIFL